MLAPEYLAGLPDRLVAQYAAVERDILADMARRIREYDFYIPAAQHQRQRLRAMGLTEEEIEARLSALTGKSREELRKLMEQAAERSLSADAAVYAAAGMSTADPLAAAGVRAVLLSGLAQTGGVFDNLTRTTAHTAGKQFTDALDRAWLQIMSGGFDYHTAIRMAVKDLARQGVASVTYPSGHTDTLEVAVRRAVVTGCNQTAAKAQIALMDELGVELVETSAHAGARPSHAVWQGRIFCRHGRTDRYENFEEATGYGTGPGLCGWNCSHSFGPYIEGAPRAYSPEMLARYEEQTVTYNGKELTWYEAGQQQRYIERQIRRWKREYAAMDAAGLDTGEAAAKLSAWREREKDFCRQTGFKRQGARSQVAGIGRTAKAWKSAGGHGETKPGVPVQVGTVNFSDKKAVFAWLDKAQQETAGLSYEVNYSVTADGKVWRVSGAEARVDPASIPSGLRGSYSYHNHPRSKTWYSFSADDVQFFFEAGEEYSKASDHVYEYIMARTPETLAVDPDVVYHMFDEIYWTDAMKMAAEEIIDADIDAYHETMRRLSEKYHFFYERREIDVRQ